MRNVWGRCEISHCIIAMGKLFNDTVRRVCLHYTHSELIDCWNIGLSDLYCKIRRSRKYFISITHKRVLLRYDIQNNHTNGIWQIINELDCWCRRLVFTQNRWVCTRTIGTISIRHETSFQFICKDHTYYINIRPNPNFPINS